MGSTRVLVATEFRSYREAIAHVIKSLRPDVEVRVAEPSGLDLELSEGDVGFVVCSRTTPLIESTVPVWIELHPDDDAVSRVSVRGETKNVEGIQLSDILDLVEITTNPAAKTSPNGNSPASE